MFCPQTHNVASLYTSYLTGRLKDGIMERKDIAIARLRGSQYVSAATDLTQQEDGVFPKLTLLGDGAAKSPVQ